MWLLKVRLGECCSHVASVCFFFFEVSVRLNDKLECTAQVPMVTANCCEACGLFAC